MVSLRVLGGSTRRLHDSIPEAVELPVFAPPLSGETVSTASDAILLAVGWNAILWFFDLDQPNPASQPYNHVESD
jgi:hypothetical protein